MKADLYTKCVLTVIAACLMTISFRMLQNPPPAAAQNDGLRVVISGFDRNNLSRGLPVNILGAGENAAVPVTLAGGGSDGKGSVPVHVIDPAVPVAVLGAGREGRLPVPVNLTQVGSGDISRAGVPVVMAAQEK